MTLELSPIEREVMDRPVGEIVRLTPAAVDQLLASPAYHASLGDPGHAVHYRRILPDGSGFHLVITEERAELHRDRFHPHAGPASMMMHLATESPVQILSLLTAGWSVLRRIGR